MLKRPLRLYCVYLKAELFSCADGTRCCGTLNTVEPLSRRFHARFTLQAWAARERRRSGACRAGAARAHCPFTPVRPFHTASVGGAWAAQKQYVCRAGAARAHCPFTPASHCKRKQGVSSAEAVRMQSRSSARPLPFHTCSVCSARLNSVFCTEWANSNLILNTIGLDLLE